MTERTQGAKEKKYRGGYSHARRLYNKFTDGALHPIRAIIRMAQKEIGILRAYCEKNIGRWWYR